MASRTRHFVSKSRGPDIAACYRTIMSEALGKWVEAADNPVAVAEDFALERTRAALNMYMMYGYVDEEQLFLQMTSYCNSQVAIIRQHQFAVH